MILDLSNTNWENIKKGVEKYLLIMKLVKKLNVQTNKEFQKTYNGFYRIRQKPKEFYELFYEYIENNKNNLVTFKETLSYFQQKFHRFEPSFSSKIVATINPGYPVWDSEVLARLGLKTPSYNLENKIRSQKMIEVYDNIIQWYFDFLKTEEARDVIKSFNEKVGLYDITDTKRIDLILWQTRH